MILNKLFVLITFSLFSIVPMAAEVKPPVEKTMMVSVNSETLKTGLSPYMEIFFPELRDDLQGSHQGGRFSTVYFSNAKSIVYLLLQEAIRNNNSLEAKVEVRTELRRVYEYRCDCSGSNCPFGLGKECRQTDKFSEHVQEKVEVNILGFKFSSEERLPIKSDQL
jgi:hypothetical protein